MNQQQIARSIADCVIAVAEGPVCCGQDKPARIHSLLMDVMQFVGEKMREEREKMQQEKKADKDKVCQV